MAESIDESSSIDERPDIDDLLSKLEVLHETVDTDKERKKVEDTISLAQRLPGSGMVTRTVKKYTTRDIAEGFVGGIIFMLPLLVEDGVFDIAAWFAAFTVGPIPIFLTLNVLFIVVIVTGLLYYTDFREVQVTRPIFGIIPRRLVGILGISFAIAASMMYLWGRLHEGDPTTVEQAGRIAVLWTASAIGATLGDILPGESSGDDISHLLSDDWDRGA